MCLIAKVFLFSVCNFVHRASSEWTPPWMQLKFARSSLTFSVAMSTRTFTLHLPSPWMTPRCFLPMPAWTRYTQCLSQHCFLHHGSSLCSHWFTTFRISSEIRSSKLSWKKKQTFFFLKIFLFFAPHFFSSSPSSSTLLIHHIPWPGCVVLPTPRSVFVQEANTMIWTMWVKMSTTTPSLRCWAPGPLGTTLRYYIFSSFTSVSLFCYLYF